MKKTIFIVILFNVCLYIIQFLIIPYLYSDVIGRGHEGMAVLCITTTIVTMIGMITFSNKFSFWLIGIVIYALLIILYSPEGAYGIGITGLDLDGLYAQYNPSARFLGICIVAGLVLFFQFVIWCIIKLFKFYYSKVHRISK